MNDVSANNQKVTQCVITIMKPLKEIQNWLQNYVLIFFLNMTDVQTKEPDLITMKLKS